MMSLTAHVNGVVAVTSEIEPELFDVKYIEVGKAARL
jgi:hypothetical protein